MLVKAKSGVRVPKEGKPRDYITDAPPDDAAGFDVPDSAYYRRRIADGDLVEVSEVSQPKSKPKKGA